MATYLSLPGPCFYSDFRLRALEKALSAKAVRALWVHYVHLQGTLSEEEMGILKRLLTFGEQADDQDPLYKDLLKTVRGEKVTLPANTQIFYVTPREGTTTPWSTKATNIAQSCHLGHVVKRIEWGRVISVGWETATKANRQMEECLHDRMSQLLSQHPPLLELMFASDDPSKSLSTDVQSGVLSRTEDLEELNVAYGLGLQSPEIEYLRQTFSSKGSVPRAPTHVELYMFAQINSEHCRHKTFNADWTIDDARKDATLFGMIKATHEANPQFTVSAYSDNAAVFQGEAGVCWAPQSHPDGHQTWTQRTGESVEMLGKVETHNHPTAVSPFPGAATGSGGEIRDEGAVGRGSKPKAGLAGFAVSDLLIPDHHRPWEHDIGRPNHIASSFQIMIDAPLGAARYSNEFGRPCTTGYFRTFQQRSGSSGSQDASPGATGGVPEKWRGYHKPIMVAGGVGVVRPVNALKDAKTIVPGAWIVVLGGPAMLVGMGGAALSSVTSGHSDPEMDYSSVQRADAEMERRAQMVIDACAALPGTREGAVNPIQLIHDVGAGGLSVAIPELLHDSELGGELELRSIPRTGTMTALQIWCCEAQERYVMIVNDEDKETFEEIAKRERCPFSMPGRTRGGSEEHRIVVTDKLHPGSPPIDLPLSVLFGKSSKKSMEVKSVKPLLTSFDNSLTSYLPTMSTDGLLREAIDRVLTLPAVGSKSFLITIGDRTVGGLTARDQMVGPWQIPVADVSVTATSLQLGVKTGEAMSMGERPILALLEPAASARMAVAEALMNLAAADIRDGLRRVKLSANWMAAASRPGEAAALYEAVKAVSEMCPLLGVSIPVGKDSMSMSMAWTDDVSQTKREISAPISAVITAFAAVSNIRKTWTPTLRRVEDVGETVLVLVDLGEGHQSMGGSALAQVFSQLGDSSPDVRKLSLISGFFSSLEKLRATDIVLAYHDRSDGGLLTTLVEMMFAGRCGLSIDIHELAQTASPAQTIPALFNEEIGAVFQIRKHHESLFRSCFSSLTKTPPIITLGHVLSHTSATNQTLTIHHNSTIIYTQTRAHLQSLWSQTSHLMSRHRDAPSCADAEYSLIASDNLPGLSYNLTFSPSPPLPLSSSTTTTRPLVAILREQGVNGHAEMAFAFHTAGFTAVDVHMTDLLSGRTNLSSFVGLAACGGFSYGDCLSAGQGWAMSVLHNANLRSMFHRFFTRPDTFTLGVCNGCQFLSKLTDLIPGTEHWPTWVGNESEQYEARLCMVEVVAAATTTKTTDTKAPRSESVFFRSMNGSCLPVAVAHGEGRARFKPGVTREEMDAMTALRYTRPGSREPTEQYPWNPNGSPAGVAGVTSWDGRVLALMPHPERALLADCVSFVPDEERERWGEKGPWGRMFESAREWVG